MRGRQPTTMLAVAAALITFGAGPAGAQARADGGLSADAPGQAQATANCEATVLTQEINNVTPGGGPKVEAGVPGPTNCDHWYQDDQDLIGHPK